MEKFLLALSILSMASALAACGDRKDAANNMAAKVDMNATAPDADTNAALVTGDSGAIPTQVEKQLADPKKEKDVVEAGLRGQPIPAASTRPPNGPNASLTTATTSTPKSAPEPAPDPHAGHDMNNM